MFCKIYSVPLDAISELASDNFNDDMAEAAKCLLCDHVDEGLRIGIGCGQNKTMCIDGIAKMMLEWDRANLPMFVAMDLSKLPPISVDCIDVSSLMREHQLMVVELSSMKEIIQNVLKATALRLNALKRLQCMYLLLLDNTDCNEYVLGHLQQETSTFDCFSVREVLTSEISPRACFWSL